MRSILFIKSNGSVANPQALLIFSRDNPLTNCTLCQSPSVASWFLPSHPTFVSHLSGFFSFRNSYTGLCVPVFLPMTFHHLSLKSLFQKKKKILFNFLARSSTSFLFLARNSLFQFLLAPPSLLFLSFESIKIMDFVKTTLGWCQARKFSGLSHRNTGVAVSSPAKVRGMQLPCVR